MDTLSNSLAAAGVALATSATGDSTAAGSYTRYGTVVANNGSTLDVKVSGATIAGVLMTTACFAAQAGDRVLLDVTGPLVTATGILATSDNVPYVKLAASGVAGGWNVKAWRYGNLVTVQMDAASPWSATEKWGVSICRLPPEVAPESTVAATGQMADTWWDNVRPIVVYVTPSAQVTCSYKGFVPASMVASFTYLCG